METSEEDAGASANASRRVSAREKDVGRIEDVDTTNIAHQEPSEPQASCETNAMSEDNFDGDSVPSPSTQDVNTSTEAILDMIDEIVDGPGAPKRLSVSPEHRNDSKTEPENPPVTDIPTKSDEVVPTCSSSVSIASSETSISAAKSETTENVSHSQATSSELETNVSTEEKDNPEQSCSKEISVNSLTDSPSSSEVISDKDCGPSERTIQSAVLCDKNDKMNVESAVSTSSDNNHDSRDSSVSVSTRSPLRRRLVRPVPSRPDSTVTSSSSVDSSVNSEVTQSECTVKDVSSSSDIVTTVNESKPEEIRNISEVSPCRAETSMGSPKKIRLIRQKVPLTNVDNVDVKQESKVEECHSLSLNSQCQGSKPTNLHSSNLPEETIHSNVEIPLKDSCAESINPKQESLEVKSQENTQQSIESPSVPSSIVKIEEESKKVPPIKLNLPVKEPSVNASNFSSENETPSQDSDTQRQVPKLTIKIGSKPSEEMKSPIPKLTIKTLKPPESECKKENAIEQISVEKSQEVKSPIPKLTIKTLRLPESECKNENFSEQISIEMSEEKKSPIPKLTIKTLRPPESESKNENISVEIPTIEKSEEIKSPIPKLTIKALRQPESERKNEIISEETSSVEKSEAVKSPIPKLTIKTLRSTESEGKNEMVSEVISSDKKSEEIKSPIPKLTIKTLRPPELECKNENVIEPCSSAKLEEMKLPIPKLTIKTMRPPESDSKNEIKLPEKINELHRKSSSSEISESECSENDESSNTSDQASTSDHGPTEIVPKVTIKLGKPGTDAEGQFYTEKNSSKSTVKTLQSSECEAPLSPSKLQVFMSQPEEMQPDRIPKLTIKTVTSSKFGNQPLSPKLTLKPTRTPDSHQVNESSHDTDSTALHEDSKDNYHVPKITIKAISKPDSDLNSKSKKSHHIVPLVKSTDSIDVEENDDKKVPVVSKSNIKSIVKPKDSVIESSKDDIPKIPKLNIKLQKNPVLNSCEETICDDMKVDKQESSIPVVKKINIKPIIKPLDTDTTKETKIEASGTDNSSDENADNIEESISIVKDNDNRDESVPVVSKLKLKLNIKPEEASGPSSPKMTKLHIKPIVKPDDSKEKIANDEVSESHVTSIVKDNDNRDESVPVVSKLKLKLNIKPEEASGPSSPKMTKLHIKPIVKPDDLKEKITNDEVSESHVTSIVKDNDNRDESVPVVSKLKLKLNIKPEEASGPSSPKMTKLNIKPRVNPDELKEKITNDEVSESHVKNPPLLLKINMKTAETYVSDQINLNKNDHGHCNNIDKDTVTKVKSILSQNIDSNIEAVNKDLTLEKDTSKLNCHSSNDSTLKANELRKESDIENPISQSAIVEVKQSTVEVKQNCHPKSDKIPHVDQRNEKDHIQEEIKPTENKQPKTSTLPNSGVLSHTNTAAQELDLKEESAHIKNTSNTNDYLKESIAKAKVKSLSSKQNCTLLKKLLESNTESVNEDKNIAKISTQSYPEEGVTPKHFNSIDEKVHLRNQSNIELNHGDLVNDKNNLACNSLTSKSSLLQDKNKKINENLTKPLEISVSEKLVHSPDQDSPRIILKINKIDLSATSKTYNDDVKDYNALESPEENVNEKHQGKNLTNRRKKVHVDTPMPDGKRLRSSRVVNSVEKAQISKQILNKRPSSDKSPPQKDLKLLDTKRMKLGHLLSSKPVAPITSKASSLSPATKNIEEKEDVKIVNHTVLNNENCAKNGSSKLHNILTNLQNKQLHNLPFNDLTHRENNESPDLKSSTSTGSIEIEIERTSPITPKMHEMIFQESSESREFNIATEEMLKDPLEVDTNIKDTPSFLLDNLDIPKAVDVTPQPKKRGRPRKIPLSEGAKVVQLPVMALEERPQRSLRLSRERPPLVVKPRGRGRGRGRRLTTEPKDPEYSENKTLQPIPLVEPKQEEEIDPTSSRIKLPRMTEALDKMPCSTPLSSRRRNSSSSDLFEDSQDFKGEIEADTSLPKMENPFLKSPDMFGSGRGMRARGGRGGRGRPAKTPRGRGRGRGGGRGAMYMKETMGIYGRVCGPATTTVQLFEEETCMMDDNATPSKPAHLLDEDSQSSVKSSTNESSKMKKSKFADLFDSNKIWTADDVKEYTWPPEDSGNDEHQVMMIQEQVAMFLGVKSFKRRYPELKRRTITGDEKNYVLQKGLVTEALCDLGITAVDASEVLDIMLSDYPHKYEEYRSHQRIKQLNEPEPEEVKIEVKVERVEMKLEQKPTESKPEPPKVDPEKLRLEMAAAAVASASEWNARMNALRRGACADLQSMTVLRRRAPPPAPTVRVRPPAGFYPHALLPGQYQHTYRRYTPQELRYFPLNTVLAAPPAPPSPAESSSDSEPEWGSRYTTSDDSDTDTHRNAKRKKLTKTKRNSQETKEEEVVDTCRKCSLRLEANRRYTHERFLVCATCNCKLHPGCVDLQPDTIRKAREYAWQCAECKTCGGCARAAGGAALHCDLCDRAYHTACLGLQTPPSGRWHCVDCSVCKSCGARSPAGLGADDGASAGTSTPSAGTSTPSAGSSTPAGASDEPRWHHQTRRGPGGHKVYSHSLCTPCARAYRIGRYCPLCERSFIGPKGTMQLVICKLCDRQLHQECVRQTVSQLKVLDYTCGECRRGGITSRAAAVRLAPRTIATLFMAKRRFNKYAHRQYLQSRQQQADAQDDDDDH